MSRDRNAAHTIACAVAPLLPGWRAELVDSDWADLVRADGARIRVIVGGWQREGRVGFLGCSPKYADGSPCYFKMRPEITCAASRPAHILAREVRRRLLPDFDHAFAQAVAQIEQHDAAWVEAREVAQRIAASIGGRDLEDRTGKRDGIHIRGEPNAVYRLRVHPAYQGIDPHPVRVDFEAHGLDPETAAEVLRLIKASEERRHAGHIRVVVALEEPTDEGWKEADDRERARRRVG